MKKLLFAICMMALFGMSAGEAQAQVVFGAQANWASEVDLGLGARATFKLPVENLTIVPSFDFFFPSTGVDGASMKWMELSGNVHYSFPLADKPTLLPYAGGGLSFVRVSATVDLGPFGKHTASGNETGLNLLGGVQFRSFAKLVPFAELRLATAGESQLVLTGGVNF